MGAPLKASNKLLDFLLKSRGLKSDAELAMVLDMRTPHISKIRNLVTPVSAETILRIHDKLGLSIAEIRALMN